MAKTRIYKTLHRKQKVDNTHPTKNRGERRGSGRVGSSWFTCVILRATRFTNRVISHEYEYGHIRGHLLHKYPITVNQVKKVVHFHTL